MMTTAPRRTAPRDNPKNHTYIPTVDGQEMAEVVVHERAAAFRAFDELRQLNPGRDCRMTCVWMNRNGDVGAVPHMDITAKTPLEA